MNDKLKPVNCGCGGEAKAWSFRNNRWYIKCQKCCIGTSYLYTTEAEAVTAWNRAMSERTAKVENQYRDYLPYTHFMEDDLRGNCENCGETVWKGEKYCHECGARLNWGDDEEDIPIEYFENGGI